MTRPFYWAGVAARATAHPWPQLTQHAARMYKALTKLLRGNKKGPSPEAKPLFYMAAPEGFEPPNA